MTDSHTPILDYLGAYDGREPVRLHMPGHKGRTYLCAEQWDITEIDGADNLYYPEGIIAESEGVATALFGSRRTVYSTGGSSQSIFAALWLLRRYAADKGLAPLVLAARNVHQAFVSGVAQTGLDVDWFYPQDATDIACPISPVALESHLRSMPIRPIAVYVTSPDYLGNMQPIAEIAEVCHRFGVLLAVDNAHGAYLKFLDKSRHPLDLGADIVADSAHKTLCALTGAAYLHFGKDCPDYFPLCAKEAMLTAGSTSPSYLIMASLDSTNAALSSQDYPARLNGMAARVADAKARLTRAGWQCLGDEPLKLTLLVPGKRDKGRDSVESALRAHNVTPEYVDDNYVILMASADTPPAHLEKAVACLTELQPTAAKPLPTLPPRPQKALTIRDAYLAARETLPIGQCVGKTLAYLPVKCPPAVPAVIAGERLTAEVIAYLEGRGYGELTVVKA